jgi:hypothetical protein
MDTDTMIIIAAVAGPAWAIVNIAVAKYAAQMFASVNAQAVNNQDTVAPGK